MEQQDVLTNLFVVPKTVHSFISGGPERYCNEPDEELEITD
jgi:hypothetical protein